MPHLFMIAADKGELFLFRITFLPLAALTVYPLVTCSRVTFIGCFTFLSRFSLPNQSIPQKSLLFKI
jgi:hypothetical protein